MKKQTGKKLLLIFVILAIVGVAIGEFLLYGPWSGFREWLITTAMTTMTHQYLATTFYSNSTIEQALSRNTINETDEISDASEIIDTETLVVPVGETKVEYENEYERAVLERDPENEDYKIIEIKGKKYSGYLAVIYNPAKIQTIYSNKLGTCGQYLKQMAKDNDALIAVNGGGFEDPNYSSNGANPLGITISNGKVLTDKGYDGAGGLIGFTEDNKLVLGKMTVQQAKEMKIRDAVTFGPFLIVNGKSSKISGNGGWGTAPRTAIGQRKDGIVLFLVIDGRTITRPGATMGDLIEIMENYGAYNAANLDGGTSSAMVVNGEIINDPVDSSGAHRTRYIATGFALMK